MRRSLATIGLALACTLGATHTRASALYVLAEGTQLQEGCFPPCLCPLFLWEEVRGTFRLAPSEKRDPVSLFDVSDVKWRIERGDTEVTITGSGTYRRGGEFALMHQLALDLAIGDEPPRHFDSGLVPGGAEFPAIAIRISLNGEVCYDTVIHVIAKPFAGCG